jgi:hypothetical protein
MLLLLRWGLPAVLIVAGFVVLAVVDGSERWDGWAMLVGSALALMFFTVVFRMGADGDRERVTEEEARAFYKEHGHWPDERAPRP